MTDVDEYSRLMAAFDELLEATAPERAARLRQWYDSDPAFARQLEALLAAEAKPSPALEKGPRVTDLLSVAPKIGSLPRSGATLPRRDARSRESLPAELGEVVGMYRLERVIGRGGMGCVYEAKHVDLGRRAAVKVLEPALTAQPDYVSRFIREAKIVNAVKHPNIVNVYDFVDSDSPRRVAIIMELLGGKTLGALLKERALSVKETIRATFQLCEALSAVHALGIVHRDLKPENVMVVGDLTASSEEGPTIKLLDFGIAKVSDPLAMHSTASGTLMGTPAYMAPEQFGAATATAATDVYAVAELVFEMLAGRPVFAGRGLQTIRSKMGSAPPRLELPESVPHAETLRSLLQDSMQLDPERRTRLHDLQSELTELFPEWSPGAATRQREARRRHRDELRRAPERRPRRLPRSLAPVALALGAAAWLGWLATRPDERRLDIPEQFAATETRESEPIGGSDRPEAERYATRPVSLPLVIYANGVSTELYRPTGPMGFDEGLRLDFEARDPDSGDTCMRVDFEAPLQSWAGVAWQDPPHDWGRLPGGYALTGASRFSLRARGAEGGETVKFGFGLILRDAKYFDSAREERELQLTDAWQTYDFDLRGRDLQRIKTGFWFAVETDGEPVTFYVNDVRFE